MKIPKQTNNCSVAMNIYSDSHTCRLCDIELNGKHLSMENNFSIALNM